MSRKATCLDNAVAENFFGLLKTELFYLEKFDSLDQLEKAIVEYIDYYNNRRIKLKLNGLSPVPSIFENAGLSGGDSLFYQVLVGLVNTLTTVLALVIIDRVGRKQLVYYGVSGMVVSLLLIGIYFLFGDSWGVSSLFLLVFFLFYVFCCAVSICAVVFVLLSEMYPTKVRGLAMSIAGFALWIGTYLIGQLTPWMLQNLTPAGTFFLFAVMCVPYMLIVWKLVPETTGKSLEEIERYWTRSE